MAAEQGSLFAAVNQAWLLQRGVGYTHEDRHRLALRLLLRTARAGVFESWTDAGNLVYRGDAYGLAGGTSPLNP
jgi:uncharacterized membrane protein (DUF441 family)